jgi:hypothetical protein
LGGRGRKILVGDQPRQKRETLSEKQTKKQKGLVAWLKWQTACLPSKNEALSSNSSTTIKKKKESEKETRCGAGSLKDFL